MTPTSQGKELTNETETISHGSLTLNLRGFSVSVDGVDVPVTQAEFLLLVTLARSPYSVIDRATLSRTLHEHAMGPQMNTPLRAVDTHIARLRRKLAAANCDCIRTMRNVGYRFVPPTGCIERAARH